mmetsp:Transcript_2941/g.2776  ORF Transcript_2941/g.2776 Transcript_2941/m.2776 type:complete len:99 (+) Transcript_2941:183-479(+)
MLFIKQSDQIKEITAMRLSPNKRFLAVCEKHKNDSSAYLSIYDVKRDDNRKSLSIKQIKNSINVVDLVTPFSQGPGNQNTSLVKETSYIGSSSQLHLS